MLLSRRELILILLTALVGTGLFFGIKIYLNKKEDIQARNDLKKAVEKVMNDRQLARQGSDNDPFGEDNIVRVLVLGLDSRVGIDNGHCDAIQLVEINKNKDEVNITAVPRGTYSPLPGTGYKPSDYYVANACSFGGLEYGIKQIEKILGQQTDYVVVVGFSESVGILRYLKLPTTETLQFLRQRQGYAIGEPQRAHNHSTFLKHLLLSYLPEEVKSTDTPFDYLLYSLVQTDLSFKQAQIIYSDLIEMHLPDNKEKIKLQMRPAYAVADIAYDPSTVGNYVDGIVSAIADRLPPEAYSGKSLTEIQEILISYIDENINDAEFVDWAYNNKVWLQIENDNDREAYHYQILLKYLNSQNEKDEKISILTDYISEMQYMELNDYAIKAEKMLEAEVGNGGL